MYKLSLNPRTTTTTKIQGGKFQLSENSRNNLKQNSNRQSAQISNRSKTKIKNCMITLAECVEDNKKKRVSYPHGHQQPLVASAGSRQAPATSRSVGGHAPLAYFTTLTTTTGTTETEAKKYLNIYLTQLRKSQSYYLWTIEQSTGGIVHFHLLTFCQPTPNWKNITKNWFKDASKTEPVIGMTQFKKVLNYMLKDETKETITGKKYGTSRSIHNYKPIDIKITTEQYEQSAPQVVTESEWFQVSSTKKQIKTALRQHYNTIYLAKQSASQISIEMQIENYYASQGFYSFGSAVPPLVPI